MESLLAFAAVNMALLFVGKQSGQNEKACRFATRPAEVILQEVAFLQGV